jgi:hypothetical protein
MKTRPSIRIAISILVAWISFCAAGLAAPADAELAVVRPEEYPGALRNPLMGFTNRGFNERNEWATLAHSYIRWNEIENRESDGIEKIRAWCDAKWKGVEANNMKVIPRVYLHWSGDQKYWPADMQPDDYSSAQFVARATRLIGRLGELWDRDPRVAWVELGIIGKWGEHHSPSPSAENQRILGDAFARAFPHKQILVRHPWKEFTDHNFGAYWDSWGHANQMDSHGAALAGMTDRWPMAVFGGEAAYGWGDASVQPGDNPTDTVVDPAHRLPFIDSIRALHCTQLRWVADYDEGNPAARAGAEEVQRAFGYRFVVTEARFPRRIEPGAPFEVAFDVVNTGSAPFYENWPVELSLLDPATERPVWREFVRGAGIRQWMPGDGWNATPGVRAYARPPQANTVSGTFTLGGNVPSGEYLLSIAVLDPAGNLPSLRFAIKNYIKGGRHPLGRIGVGVLPASATLDASIFDDPHDDLSLRYDKSYSAAAVPQWNDYQ